MQLPEKYKENFDVLSENSSSRVANTASCRQFNTMGFEDWGWIEKRL
jgi:hypothetical protein